MGGVTGGATRVPPSQPMPRECAVPGDASRYPAAMLEKITELREQAAADLQAMRGSAEGVSAGAIEKFRIKYLGSKGAVKDLMGLMKDVPRDLKKDFGQGANALKAELTEAYEAAKAEVEPGPGDNGGAGVGAGAATSAARSGVGSGAGGGSGGGSGVGGVKRGRAAGPRVDITLPGSPPRLGRRHIITQTIDEILELFGRIGFTVATGPEVEDDYHNFIALNIPAEHPARDPLDNFYLTDPDDPRAQSGQARLMRSQTSTVQVRVMENTPPPVRIVSVGRVYRPDEHDATHYSMFHQVEGLYVDEGVTMVDLKTTLVQFARAMFGPDTEIDLVPSYFPFTEPSAELYVKIDLGKGPEWMELGGCGMFDPAVFEHVGYDAERWTGWAFGLGIERIAMRKHGISDIRWLFENDVRFLRQF